MRLSRTLLCMAAILLTAGPLRAQDEAPPVIPQLWDARERLPQPDLSLLPRLRFLTTTDFPPFNSLDAQGRLVGFHVDLARAICERLAMGERCQIQALPWNELPDALQRGEGEAIIAGLGVTAERRETLAFSRPYLLFPGRFLARRDAALPEPLTLSLKAKRIGVVRGSAHERFLRDTFEGLDIAPEADEAALIAGVREGRTDAGFGDGMRLSFFLAGAEGSACCRFAGGPFLAPSYFGPGLSIAVRRDDEALLQALDAALQGVSTGNRFTEIYLRHFPVSFF